MAPSSIEVLQYTYAMSILIIPVLCGLERTCTPAVKAQGRRGQCGSQLSQLVSMACFFRGYHMGGKKRSDDQTKDIEPQDIPIPAVNKSLPQTIDSFKEELKKQFVSKRQAAAFLVKKSAYAEQGIVCECCYFRCSMSEIADYCQDDGGFFKRASPPGNQDLRSKTILDKIHIGVTSKQSKDEDENDDVDDDVNELNTLQKNAH